MLREIDLIPENLNYENYICKNKLNLILGEKNTL